MIKANGGGEKISLELISSLRKAEVKYKAKHLSLGKRIKVCVMKIEEAYKELGTEDAKLLPRNQIASCKSES